MDSAEDRWRPDKDPPARPTRRRLGRAALALLAWLGVGAGLLALVAVAVVAYHLYTLPLPTAFREPQRLAFTVVDGDGDLLGERGVLRGETVPLDRLPQHLVDAVVAFEDRRFFHHSGVNPLAVLRAAAVNLISGEIRQGGSTITQQLVKLEFLSPERTLDRKIQEALLSVWLERRMTKAEILERYLNVIYLGAGAYGIAAAAERYFGKPAADLTLAESAMLVGLIQAPSRYAPTNSIEVARRRAALVLDSMVATGALTGAQAEAARANPARLRHPPADDPVFGYAVDWAASAARAMLGEVSGSFQVATGIDANLQRMAHRTVNDWLDKEGRASNVTQAALLAMAPDGRILAVTGGRDHAQSQFNRAVQARRQPGSVFKTFVYLAALQSGYRRDSRVLDAPIAIEGWRPGNYGGDTHGEVTLTRAFAKSYNLAAVRLQESIGRDRIIALARSMGVASTLSPHPSLALGTNEMTLAELTAAFAAIRQGSARVEPRVVAALRTGGGGIVTAPAPAVAAATWPRDEMRELLRAVVRDGSGRAAALDEPVYGKTGTTQDHRDAWFIGFTDDLVVGVWVGNDDGAPMQAVTGGGLPAHIWHDFMVRARDGRRDRRPAEVSRPAEPGIGADKPADARTDDVAGRPSPVPAPAKEMIGAPRVIDTATLRLSGRVVRLDGVVGQGGEAAREMASYIGDRLVTCRRVVADRYRCEVDGWDLSEVVLFNGGGRATADAPSDLIEAARKARLAKRGIWASR